MSPFQTRATSMSTSTSTSSSKTSPCSTPTLSTISSLLLSSTSTSTSLLLPPLKPTHPHLTPQISLLSLHPTLEATLHMLNGDLPSAHFLVRHMQAAPAVEGMLLHGILHRCEGDMRNARLWIGDVEDICDGFVAKRREQGERLGENVVAAVRGKGTQEGFLDWVYRGDKAEGLVDEVEAWRGKKAGERDMEEGSRLEEKIRGELGRVLEWCRRKFGEGEWVDASSEWVKNTKEIQKISDDMISGDKGWRKF